MGIPTTDQIRAFLEGYGLDSTSTMTKTGTIAPGSPIITGIDTTSLAQFMKVSAISGIPVGAYILSVDSTSQITLNAPATGTGSVTLTIIYYDIISDALITRFRDNIVIPWVEARIKMSTTVDQQFSELHSGTGQPELLLNRRNIKTIDKIELLQGIINAQLNTTMVEVERWTGILRVRSYLYWESYIGYFPRGQLNLKCTYTCYAASDLDDAISALTCSRILTHLEGKTGGGDISVQAYSRHFGKRGKYNTIRNELAREAQSAMQKYITNVMGN